MRFRRTESSRRCPVPIFAAEMNTACRIDISSVNMISDSEDIYLAVQFALLAAHAVHDEAASSCTR